MINAVIGGVDVHKYITEYVCEHTPVFSEYGTFQAYDGTKSKKRIGDDVIITMRLEEVPTGVSTALAAALEADDVEVEYTSPIPKKQTFYKTAYRAECDEVFPEEIWIVTLTLHSKDIADDGDGL